ncbi:MAG: DUF971 domain-containing protein [Myxococcaceae bacterium]|nr:DUF971 domain-containing protein [Myxococcaceae bacterium]MCI0668890.1 DUF971 domain-containing protein [Myxococcaceae bacterium]
MSFWDRIKPSRPPAVVIKASLAPDGKAIALNWDDGKAGVVTARWLRQNCPCAACVDEWTNKRTLDPAAVPTDVRIHEVQSVGNYALAFSFSDGHNTGIYVWTHLRELQERPTPSTQA